MTVEWRGPHVEAAVRRAAMRGVVRGGERVLEEGTSMILEGPATGRIYRRRGVSHQASAPGEAPASDVGRLAQSGRNQHDTARLASTINWSTGYAADLEFGTMKMEPRPYARPALASQVAAIEIDIAAEVRGALG